MLENLTLNELISNIGYLCEANSALRVIKYESSSSMPNKDIVKMLPIYIQYRDELVARISNSTTVLERSSLTQMYYRLLAALRNLDNFVTYLDDKAKIAKLASGVNLELSSSYAQIENISLAGSQLDYTED
jgi:hypothetical protein